MRDYLFRKFPVNKAVQTPVSSYPNGNPISLFINLDNLRILFKKPLWRCVSRRTQNNIYIPVLKKFNRPVKPLKIKIALIRFKSAPCELSHTDNFNSRPMHHIRILNP